MHIAADKLRCDVSVYVVSIASGYIMCHDMTNAAQHESPVVTALCSGKKLFALPSEHPPFPPFFLKLQFYLTYCSLF